MKLMGTYYKDNKIWISEIPFIDLMDQGKTKSDSLRMIKSAVEELVNLTDFKCEIEDLKNGEFAISSKDVKTLSCFVLRRLREAQGLTIREVGERLGLKSHTEYARHESGKTAMTMDSFNRYVEVISSKEVIIKIA